MWCFTSFQLLWCGFWGRSQLDCNSTECGFCEFACACANNFQCAINLVEMRCIYRFVHICISWWWWRFSNAYRKIINLFDFIHIKCNYLFIALNFMVLFLSQKLTHYRPTNKLTASAQMQSIFQFILILEHVALWACGWEYISCVCMHEQNMNTTVCHIYKALMSTLDDIHKATTIQNIWVCWCCCVLCCVFFSCILL